MSTQLEIGTIVEATVVKVKPFGAIVTFGENKNGFIHISHISQKFVENINEHISTGDVVKAKILTHDEETNKISLSIKDATVTKERPRRVVREEKPPVSFEDKLNGWLKDSNERHASLNKRNKRR